MKLSLIEKIILMATALFFALMVGWFLGSRQVTPLQTEADSFPQPVTTVSPSPTADTPKHSPAPGESGLPSAPPTESAADSDKLININTASLEELVTLPGIGEKRGQAIIDHRDTHGPFQYVEELIEVSGIGEVTLEGLLELVTVGE